MPNIFLDSATDPNDQVNYNRFGDSANSLQDQVGYNRFGDSANGAPGITNPFADPSKFVPGQNPFTGAPQGAMSLGQAAQSAGNDSTGGQLIGGNIPNTDPNANPGALGLGDFAAQQQANNAMQPQSVVKQYNDALASAGQSGISDKYFKNIKTLLNDVDPTDPFGDRSIFKGMRYDEEQKKYVPHEFDYSNFQEKMARATMLDSMDAAKSEGISGVLKILSAIHPDDAMKIKKQAADVDQSVATTAKLNSETEGQAIKNKNDSQIALGNIYSAISAQQDPAAQAQIYAQALPNIRRFDPNAPDQYNAARGMVSIAQSIPALTRYQEEQKSKQIDQAANEPTDFQKNFNFIQGLTGNQKEEALAMQSPRQGPTTVVNTGTPGQNYKVPDGYMLKDPQNPGQGVTPLPGGPKDTENLKDASRRALIQDSQDQYNNLQKLVYKDDGSVNRTNLVTSTQVKVPVLGEVAGLPGTSGATLSQVGNTTAESIARALSPRTPTAEQIQEVKRNYIPTNRDSKQVVDMKMAQIKNILSLSQNYSDPNQSKQDQRFQANTVSVPQISRSPSLPATGSVPALPDAPVGSIGNASFQQAGTATPEQMQAISSALQGDTGAHQSLSPYMQAVIYSAKQAIAQGKPPEAVQQKIIMAMQAEQSGGK